MKVGDYVRTDIGEIRKVVRVTDDLYVLDKDIVFAHKDKIKKSSPSLIDLIEVGDYVNGVEVKDIDDEWVTMSDTKIPILKSIANGFIKSIVTKEQIESIEYKVKE